jgi:hypothetical protein
MIEEILIFILFVIFRIIVVSAQSETNFRS